MIRKISEKLFVIFASLLLVSHAIVPHLHFNHEIFIITPTCITDDEHKHNAPEHNSDNTKDDSDACPLKPVVLARLNDLESEIQKVFTSLENLSTGSFAAIIFDESFFVNTFSNPHPSTQLPTSVYAQLVDGCINLRGSPLV